MKAVYINLDAAADRRAEVEAGFARVPHAGWELVRFPAVSAAEMADAPGRLPAPHKGCFESHRRVVGGSLDDAEPLLILEDDVLFSKATFSVLSGLVAADDAWDLLFCDVGLSDPQVMCSLARISERLRAEGRIALYDLQDVHFCGTTAYVVRGSSKAKLAHLLKAAPLDQPYDLHLRELVKAGELRAKFCFPFVTSISPAADDSQIGGAEGRDLAFQGIDGFRRLMFCERDLAASRETARRISSQFDELTRMAAVFIGTVAKPR